MIVNSESFASFFNTKPRSGRINKDTVPKFLVPLQRNLVIIWLLNGLLTNDSLSLFFLILHCYLYHKITKKRLFLQPATKSPQQNNQEVSLSNTLNDSQQIGRA